MQNSTFSYGVFSNYVGFGKILNFISNHNKLYEMKPKAFAHKIEWDYELIQAGKRF